MSPARFPAAFGLAVGYIQANEEFQTEFWLSSARLDWLKRAMIVYGYGWVPSCFAVHINPTTLLATHAPIIRLSARAAQFVPSGDAATPSPLIYVNGLMVTSSTLRITLLSAQPIIRVFV